MSAGVQQPSGLLTTAAATHFFPAFISAMRPDTDLVATAAVLYTVKRPRTDWALALGVHRHLCPDLPLIAACMMTVLGVMNNSKDILMHFKGHCSRTPAGCKTK